ncbi:MAG: hypothetical protein IRY83_17870 [Chloroflexi bacterium]|nr:hypothetical protein [Chloroflexota bacterium]
MTASSEEGQPAGTAPDLNRVDWEALKRDIRRILTEGPTPEEVAEARENLKKYPIESSAASDGPHSIILTSTVWVTPKTPAAPDTPRLTRKVRGAPRARPQDQ